MVAGMFFPSVASYSPTAYSLCHSEMLMSWCLSSRQGELMTLSLDLLPCSFLIVLIVPFPQVVLNVDVIISPTEPSVVHLPRVSV